MESGGGFYRLPGTEDERHEETTEQLETLTTGVILTKEGKISRAGGDANLKFFQQALKKRVADASG